MTTKQLGIWLLAVVCGCWLAPPVSISSSRAEVLVPTVVAARVPFYPPLVQRAHMEGLVKLRITTDGTRPSAVDAITGQPMLAAAAIENVKTWEFEPHAPTTFEVAFHYKLLPSKCDSNCNCQSAEVPSVILRLPTEIEIRASEMMICDPIENRP